MCHRLAVLDQPFSHRDSNPKPLPLLFSLDWQIRVGALPLSYNLGLGGCSARSRIRTSHPLSTVLRLVGLEPTTFPRSEMVNWDTRTCAIGFTFRPSQRIPFQQPELDSIPTSPVARCPAADLGTCDSLVGVEPTSSDRC